MWQSNHANPHIMKNNILFVLIIGISLLACSHAQQTAAELPMPELNSKTRAAVVERVALLMSTNYVDPEKGELVAARLRNNHKAKAYKALKDPNAFAAHLLKDMQAELHDVHLNFSFRPQMVMGSAYDGPDVNIEMDGPLDEEDGEAVIIIEEGPGEGGGIDGRIPEEVVAAMRNRNFGLTKTEILTGNVGYFRIDDFMAAGPEAAAQVKAVMQYLQHCQALIIDVRNNPGGGPFMIQQICSYFFEEPTHLNSLYHRPSNSTQDFWTEKVSESKMLDKPIYVLASGFTGSAAEEFAYDLQTQKRATIVGETTAGGGHIVEAYDAGHGFELNVPNGKAINPITQTNWEGVGVKPDVEAPASQALQVAHAKALRDLIASASSPIYKQQLTWAVERLEAQSKPIQVAAEMLKRYEGTYGPRVVEVVEGELRIQRAPGPQMTLVPMSERKFMYADLDPFRLEFVVEKGVVKGLKLTFPEGGEDFFEKE